MNIGIDIDDTIANTYDVLFKYLQEYTKDDIIECAIQIFTRIYQR